MESKIPHHLAIIVDGNRRWAKERGLPSIEGHRRGLDNLKKIGEQARQKGVKILTVFIFSTENWERPKIEVSYLMALLGRALNRENISDLQRKGIKLKVIGQIEKLAKSLQEKIRKAEDLTKDNKNGIFNLAVSYGGRAEIIEAVKKIISKKIPAEKVSEELINQHLWTEGQPYPDLIIRTSGEHRISNFLVWQSAYSELYFSPKHWPDFSEKDLDEAFLDYSQRQRRFGK